jgi:hypothetical protein
MYTPKPGTDFATLAKKSRRALQLEAAAQGQRLREIDAAAVTGCPRDLDNRAWKALVPASLRKARQELTLLGQHQARLNLYNAFEHLSGMHRLLGSDGQLAALTPTTLSRVTCESAVNVSRLLDTDASAEVRLVRSAAALYNSALSEVKAANKMDSADPGKAAVLAEAQDALDKLDDLLDRAQVDRVLDSKGRKVVSLQIPSAGVKVPVEVQMGPEMEARLPEVPTWYTRGSGVAHGATWRLRQVVKAGSGAEDPVWEPDLVEIAEASIAAIHASALVIKCYARYFGLDPDPYVVKSRSRAQIIEAWKQNWIGLQTQERLKASA